MLLFVRNRHLRRALRVVRYTAKYQPISVYSRSQPSLRLHKIITSPYALLIKLECSVYFKQTQVPVDYGTALPVVIERLISELLAYFSILGFVVIRFA